MESGEWRLARLELADLLRAKQSLSPAELSPRDFPLGPPQARKRRVGEGTKKTRMVGPKWIRTIDLTLIRGAL